jgi:ribosomal protein S18 acetylase RimI-like enzyme
MREKDIELVKARTSIPRSTQTLLSLKSVGVFEKRTNIAGAWTFLGLDGSLTTLHTEPQYRGKGIAKAVAAKIFREHAPELAVDEGGVAWAHADVYKGNVQSEAVCASLGGNALWTIFWVRVDFSRAGILAKGSGWDT